MAHHGGHGRYRGGRGYGYPGGGVYWGGPSWWIEDCPNPYNPYCRTIYALDGDKPIDIDTVTQPLATQMVAGEVVVPIVRPPVSTQQLPKAEGITLKKIVVAGVLVAGIVYIAKVFKLI